MSIPEIARSDDSRISVRPSPIHGRGVFATAPIQVGEVIETCPVLRIPAAQLPALDATLLYEYYFSWGSDGGVALGYGSLYNHDDDQPNAAYEKDFESDIVVIRAIRAIAGGDEITFSYSGEGDGAAPAL